jgi:all-trans-retinol 13,14-reductase
MGVSGNWSAFLLPYPMIQSYKQSPKLASQYDAILIGSGLGSLTAAVLLSKAGKKVLVLERHYTAGGYTHVFKRKGYEWDVGIHYIGEMGRKRSVIYKLFDYITEGQLEWADMGEIYDRIVIGDKVYDFVKGVENWRNKLVSYFPEEEEAIDNYINKVFQCVKTSRNFYVEKAMAPLIAKVSGNYMRAPFLKYASRSTREVLEELTQNEELIKVLTGQYGDYGLPPAESSFAMHAALVRHYFSGGYFPVGGSSRIMDTIEPVLEQDGSTVLVRAEVEEVLIEGKKAVGVKMADGQEFRAPVVISGAGIITTYQKLLPEAVVAKYKLMDQVGKVKASASHACLYMGLTGTPEELQLPKANYWIYPDGKTHEELVEAYLKDINEPFPLVYVSFPAAKDPDWSNRYPGKSTIDIITLMPYDVFQPWEDDRWKKRGEDYEALKESISQRLMEALFKLEPQLRGKVDYYELSTPVTTRHFMNYDKGEIYGIDHGPDRFQQKFLRPHTPIKNLFLTGQDIVTAGIGGALFSGLLTASAVTGKNFFKEIM